MQNSTKRQGPLGTRFEPQIRSSVTAGGSLAVSGHRGKWSLDKMLGLTADKIRGWGSDEAGELGATQQGTL